MIRVNGVPLELVQPETFRFKVFEPLMILGKDKFSKINMRIRARGGGMTAQIYGNDIFF
jgi:small subunit ribosomal protein S16e